MKQIACLNHRHHTFDGQRFLLAFGSRHRLPSPSVAGLRSAKILARPAFGGTPCPLRILDVPLTEWLAKRCQEVFR